MGRSHTYAPSGSQSSRNACHNTFGIHGAGKYVDMAAEWGLGASSLATTLCLQIVPADLAADPQCVCQCNLEGQRQDNSNGCNSTLPCDSQANFGALCVDTVSDAPNTCSKSIQPQTWAYCQGDRRNVNDGVESDTEWAGVPVIGRDVGKQVCCPTIQIATDGLTFAFKATSNSRGIFMLAQTFNFQNQITDTTTNLRTEINVGLLDNAGAWRYVVKGDNCPNNPPFPKSCIKFQKCNDTTGPTPTQCTFETFSQAQIEYASSFDSASNTTTEEIFIPWTAVLDGVNNWDDDTNLLNLVFAGTYGIGFPSVCSSPNNCVSPQGRWGLFPQDPTGSFFQNQTRWARASLQGPNAAPSVSPALCFKAECPR